jgi:hypothetical protein
VRAWALGCVLVLASATAAAVSCPLGFGLRAVRIGGAAAGYPAECALPTCRIMSYVAQKIAYIADPFCPFCPTVPVLQWRYQVRVGAVPGNACPADVVAGPWKAP